jgi:hypothetical protein
MRKVDCVYVPVLRPDQAGVDDVDKSAVNDEQRSHAVVAPTGSEVSSLPEPTTAESKIELLESRVRALERMMSHMAPRYNDQYAFCASIQV